MFKKIKPSNNKSPAIDKDSKIIINVSYNSLLFLNVSSIFRVEMDAEKKYTIEIKSFGKRLREIRKREKLIQLELEVRCGMDRSEISKIENGLNNIEFFTVTKLATALKVELYEFFIPKNSYIQIAQKNDKIDAKKSNRSKADSSNKKTE
jgi:hypothetical protein